MLLCNASTVWVVVEFPRKPNKVLSFVRFMTEALHVDNRVTRGPENLRIFRASLAQPSALGWQTEAYWTVATHLLTGHQRLDDSSLSPVWHA